MSKAKIIFTAMTGVIIGLIVSLLLLPESVTKHLYNGRKPLIR